MSTKTDIQNAVNSIFEGHINIIDVSIVPDINDARLTFGLTGQRFNNVCFYIDMRGSTAILEKHNANVVIKIHKAFFITVLKIVRLNRGEIRSFNGDSLLAFFPGNDSTTIESALKASMQTKYMLMVDENCLKNIVNRKYNTDIDFGIGLDIGTTLVAKIGQSGYNNQDLIWIGSNVNRSVKISDERDYPNNIGITDRLYSNLTNLVKYKHGSTTNMWQKSTYVYNHSQDDVYITGYCWEID
ncbi:MAG: adenylate/guanylate cyclase domain-containing protein [Acholeplasma sp.]|nr:adenylate/guanylate cyclase domain-containing protein [Acholeplasma sp.]